MFKESLLEKQVRERYVKRFGKWYPDVIYRTKLVCQMIKNDKDFKYILDGAGFFPSAFIFSQLYKNAQITIYNLYEDDVLDDFKNSIKYQYGDVTDIKFPDKYFDMVYLGETIEHVYDITKCFKEVKRVLKPDGYLAITTPNLAAWHNRLLLLFGKCPINYHPSPITYSKSDENNLKATHGKHLRDVPLHHYHIRLFTIDRLFDYLELMGFKIIKHDIINFTTPDRRFLFIRRLLNYILPMNFKEGIVVIVKIMDSITNSKERLNL